MAVVEDVRDLIPSADRAFLEEKGFDYELKRVGAEIHVVIQNFPFPEAYDQRTATLLIILRPGYPNTEIDMFFTRPDVKLRNGNWPDRCTGRVDHGGLNWQQWSRHLNGRWRPGVDGLRSYIACIRHELSKGI
jgi:hypothetical protein